MRRRAVGFLALLALMTPFTSALPSAAQEQRLEVLEVDVDRWPKLTTRVAVPVTDRSKPAQLSADQLSVIEDTRSLSSHMVSRANVGRSVVTLVLAVDTSGETFKSDRARAIRETTKTFLSQLDPRDRVALMSLGEDVVLREPFTADRWALGSRIDGLVPTAGPRLADGLLHASVEAASAASGSRALVLLSTGNDVGSHMALTEGIAAAVRGGIPVYPIALGDSPNIEPLQRIASQTHGQLQRARSTTELADAYQFIRSVVSSQFEVTWTTKLTADPGRDVYVELRTDPALTEMQGTQFSYKQPPFANIAAAGSGSAFLDTVGEQVLEPLPMPEPPNNFQLLQAGIAAGLGAIVLYFAMIRRVVNERLRTRLGQHIDGTEPRYRLRSIAISPFAALASGALMRVLSKKQVDIAREKLVQAGFQSDVHLKNFLTAKLMLAVGILVYGFIALELMGMGQSSFVLALAFGGLGFFMPDFWLGQRIERRAREITRALPDALDMLAVGMSAGLSFDATVLEVSDKWHNSLTDELELTIREMRLGASRRESLTNLSQRTQIEDIRVLVTALVQADELGTSLADTLNLQADQLRLIRKHRAEEQAHKAAVKMLLPLVGLIFPALFVVILGPAVPELLKSLGGVQ